ncbi:hypothetical protein MSSIT_0392 [Methanosarcina siciliae T4/M]|uniref:Uncharacterized protein n=3 Tax=Methanosarcina siciliae TaxID=38027 RepID=A0A0E3PAG3_9EURY|nr:hypothetical protein [Methanosarcina siciliae]AKB27111.1 hypothetical protein MSSIT_0392 [Methanosarcina siciliae T4/M]AKB31074.1 hypothetical protein MSSIH_0384 [Methanosarcina siciliae HI350]
MKFKLIFFFMLILILLAGIFEIEALKQDISTENAQIANETSEQLEYIKNLQAESDRILTGDPDVQDLLDEKTHFRAYEIIHNESLVEVIYIVGFHPEKSRYSKGFRMVDGVVYRFYIDMNSKKVSIKEDETHEDFDPDSGLVISDYIHEEVDGISLDSSISMNTYPGGWLETCWFYQFKIEGHENISLAPESTKKPEMKYQLEVKKVTDVGYKNFYLGMLLSGDKGADVLSGNDSIPSKYWKEMRNRETHTLTISSPKKRSNSMDYFYRWDIRSNVNQTIVFDIDLIIDGLGNTAKPEELHGWRIIMNTPPYVTDLSEADMMELGIWSSYYGNYYPISTIIVKKGEWLENNSRV